MSKTASTILLLFVVALTGCGKSKPAQQAKADTTAVIVSNMLAAIAAAGEPISSADLNKWYNTEPLPATNASEIYTQAFASLTAGDPKSADYVSKNQKALGLLLQASSRKSCRYPIDWTEKIWDTQLPPLGKIKNSAILLNSAANIEAGAGRTTTATKYVLAGIQLSRSVENEPILISRLVEIASIKITVEGLEQVLTRRALSGEQLLEIQNALHNAEGVSLRRAFAGERASTISLFQISPEDWTNFNASVWELISTNLAALDIAAYKKTAVYQEDFHYALDYTTALMERADKPFPESLGSGDEPKFENAAGQKLVLSSMFLPGLNKALERAAQSAAHLRAAQTALAIERFRLQHANALPGTLTELMPAFVTAVPTDPFDGQPLRFKKLPGRGYVVYSIGKDRKDDGGMSPDSGKPSSAPDITFTVGR